MLRCTRHKALALVFGSALALSPCAPVWSDSRSDSLPHVTLKTLEGSSFVVPDDLGAAISILVVGFTREAGANTRPWVDKLRLSFTRDEGFAVYPVAVLAGIPSLFRSFALNSVKAGVDPRERGGFLVVDHGEAAWRIVAGAGKPDDPRVIVVDRAGTVLVREAGLFDEKSWPGVQARIRSFKGRTS